MTACECVLSIECSDFGEELSEIVDDAEEVNWEDEHEKPSVGISIVKHKVHPKDLLCTGEVRYSSYGKLNTLPAYGRLPAGVLRCPVLDALGITTQNRRTA